MPKTRTQQIKAERLRLGGGLAPSIDSIRRFPTGSLSIKKPPARARKVWRLERADGGIPLPVRAGNTR